MGLMRTWSLDKSAPLCLTLSADARFGVTDYANDQIWELRWWGGEIPSLHLYTSYGRRARSMLIFPAFTLGVETRQDPVSFSQPPILQQIFPNLAVLDCVPFPALHVQAEFYVPSSQVIIGRYTFQNRSGNPQAIHLRLSALLQAGEHPSPMGSTNFDGYLALSGRSADLSPVVFMSGGAQHVPAPYPSLQVAATLAPGGVKSWVWAHTAQGTPERSFETCREMIQIPWEPMMARVEMGNAGMLAIETGDPDWDAAFWITQKELLRSIVGPTAHSSNRGVVGRRDADEGYALKSDGRDHTGYWGGLSTADTFYLAMQILPMAPDLVKGLLRGILRTQNAEGELDWAPGLGGQRAGVQAMPLLSTLAWETYRWTEDRAFLEEVFPGLFSFFESWFIKRHDRDEDGFPEWDHAPHSDFPSRPCFSRFEPGAQGFNISYAETVDLAAYLYREGKALISIADTLGRGGLTALIEERLGVIVDRVESSWSEKRSSYAHVDRESHQSHSGLQIAKRRGTFDLKVKRELDPPGRLLLRLKGEPSAAKKLRVEVTSQGARKRKRTESITLRKFQSFWQWSTHTTEKLNHQIDRIKVMGIDRKLTMEVLIPDLEREDLTLALPLWAGWMDSRRISALVENKLMQPEGYFQPNGLTTIPTTDKDYASAGGAEFARVLMLWNSLIGRGMLDQGFRKEAGELLQRLMHPCIKALKDEKAFFSHYPPEGDKHIGARGAFSGVIPLNLFLAILGVRIVSPWKVWVEPGHPFPWPVKIAWQGLLLTCDADAVHITFPDGQQASIDQPGLHCVEQLSTPSLGESETSSK